MKLEQVFEKAIEGGFTLHGIIMNEHYFHTFIEKYKHESLMSPLFWKSYCNAMGFSFEHRVGSHSDDPDPQRCGCLDDEYRKYQHRFIDHIADGGTIESFFEQF